MMSKRSQVDIDQESPLQIREKLERDILVLKSYFKVLSSTADYTIYSYKNKVSIAIRNNLFVSRFRERIEPWIPCNLFELSAMMLASKNPKGDPRFYFPVPGMTEQQILQLAEEFLDDVTPEELKITDELRAKIDANLDKVIADLNANKVEVESTVEDIEEVLESRNYSTSTILSMILEGDEACESDFEPDEEELIKLYTSEVSISIASTTVNESPSASISNRDTPWFLNRYPESSPVSMNKFESSDDGQFEAPSASLPSIYGVRS